MVCRSCWRMTRWRVPEVVLARNLASSHLRRLAAASETLMAVAGIYLAGPDVFFPGARQTLAAKKALCERYGCVGLPPLDAELGARGAPTAASIFERNLALMRRADCVVANLTPFRGV